MPGKARLRWLLMKIFRMDSTCPKCGGAASKKILYFGKKSWFFRKVESNGYEDNICTCSTKEAHICRHCTVCEAAWPEAPLDGKLD